MPAPGLRHCRAEPEVVTAAGTGTPLTPEQEQRLLQNLPLVRLVAWRIAEGLPPHVELEELVSAGTVGLVDAARRFRPGPDARFRAYAQCRIRGAILDSLRLVDWSPRALRRRGRELVRTRQALEARLGRPVDEAELAAEMGITLAAVQQLAASLSALRVQSLSPDGGMDGEEQEPARAAEKESENPLLACLRGEARRRVLGAMEALPERERLIVRLYYFEEMTMREIGQVLGVVESRISQVHRETLRRLRRALAPGGRVVRGAA